MSAMFDTDEVDRTLRSVLSDVLGLPRARVDAFDADTELFGSLPEFDSMAVAGVLTELEERLAISIEDDEVDGELFARFGNLLTFARAKSLA
jgi:acyl carrier protein